jgi:hypothetical protein
MLAWRPFPLGGRVALQVLPVFSFRVVSTACGQSTRSAVILFATVAEANRSHRPAGSINAGQEIPMNIPAKSQLYQLPQKHQAEAPRLTRANSRMPCGTVNYKLYPFRIIASVGRQTNNQTATS